MFILKWTIPHQIFVTLRSNDSEIVMKTCLRHFQSFICRKAIPQILILEQSYRSSFHRKCKKFSEILYSLRDSVREKFFSNYRKTRKVNDFILVFDMESFLFYSNSGYHSACWFCSIQRISISITFLLNKHFFM